MRYDRNSAFASLTLVVISCFCWDFQIFLRWLYRSPQWRLN